MPESLCELVSRLGCLAIAAQKPDDRHVGDAGLLREFVFVPAPERHVLGEELRVETDARFVCHCETESGPVVPRCQSQIATAFHNGNQPVVRSVQVARIRPVFNRDLGLFLEQLRVGRGWTLRGAASFAARKQIALTYQVLFRMEKGQVKNPEPAVLKALAALYDVDYDDIVKRFVTKRHAVADAIGAVSAQEPSPVDQRVRLLEEQARALRGLVARARRQAIGLVATTMEVPSTADLLELWSEFTETQRDAALKLLQKLPRAEPDATGAHQRVGSRGAHRSSGTPRGRQQAS